ncbi:MAG: DUF6516 family protein [Candidatus Freyrarchaeum guaymaensis]
MLKTLELLSSHRLIKKSELLDFKQGEEFYYLRIKAILTDGSELHIREYVSKTKYLYSYHWQDNKGKLIIRWDNSPHHKHLKTFPHHKHTPHLEESTETSLEEVLKIIEKRTRRP